MNQNEEEMRMKKMMAFLLAVSFLGLTALAPDADARRGRGADNPPEAPECEVEDGGVIVCK
jgi:hypothetical protein